MKRGADPALEACRRSNKRGQWTFEENLDIAGVAEGGTFFGVGYPSERLKLQPTSSTGTPIDRSWRTQTTCELIVEKGVSFYWQQEYYSTRGYFRASRSVGGGDKGEAARHEICTPQRRVDKGGPPKDVFTAG